MLSSTFIYGCKDNLIKGVNFGQYKPCDLMISLRYFQNCHSFKEILQDGWLKSWASLRDEFDLPASNSKTYTILRASCAHMCLPRICSWDGERFLCYKGFDQIILIKTNAKLIYNSLCSNVDLIEHFSHIWQVNLNSKKWYDFFSRLRNNSIEPKKACFKWLLLLQRLPYKDYNSSNDLCSVCKKLEHIKHFF